MMYDEPYSSLSFDEKLVAEKLGASYDFPFNKPANQMDMNQRLARKMHENDYIKYFTDKDKKNKEVEKKQVIPEYVPEKTRESETEGFFAMGFNDSYLKLIILLLVVVCYFQYTTNETLRNMNMILLSRMGGVGAPVVQAVPL